MGHHLATVGAEKGATTGRDRRCGWFDAVAVKYAARINSMSGICLTKLDVLDGLDSIKVCTGYKGLGAHEATELTSADQVEKLEAVYSELPGWNDSTVGKKSLDYLPNEAIDYIKFLEDRVDVPVDIISTGPDREQTIILRNPFDMKS